MEVKYAERVASFKRDSYYGIINLRRLGFRRCKRVWAERHGSRNAAMELVSQIE